jgi:transcriptional regulator with XRE-family HTH domain
MSPVRLTPVATAGEKKGQVPMDNVVPPRRLGELLAAARSTRGTSIEVLTEQLGAEDVHVDLRQVEAGEVTLDDSQLAHVARAYGVETSSLIPSRSRLVVDLSEGVIQDERTQAAFQVAPDRDETLRRYLALVYEMRRQPPGSDLSLRDEDMDVLAEVFDTRAVEIEGDLRRLIAGGTPAIEAERSRLSRRVLVPAIGVLVALTAAGAVVFVQSSAETPAPAPATQEADAVPLDQLPPAPAADVGPPGISQERLPDGSPAPEVTND